MGSDSSFLDLLGPTSRDITLQRRIICFQQESKTNGSLKVKEDQNPTKIGGFGAFNGTKILSAYPVCVVYKGLDR